MKPENFRAIKIKNGSTFIFLKENFDTVSKILNHLKEDITEVKVTQEMLDNAQYLYRMKRLKLKKFQSLMIPNSN